MHCVHIYISEGPENADLESLRTELQAEPHVTNVQLTPHELLVEYEERYLRPARITGMLKRHGLHGDVTAC